MQDYKTFIVEYVAQAEGQKFITNFRLTAKDKDEAIGKVSKFDHFVSFKKASEIK